MKTLSSTILLLLMACFAFNNANAQSPKETYEGSYTPSVWLPCVEEVVTGEIFYEGFMHDGTIHEHLWGTVVGETTGNEYTIDQLWNISEKDLSKNSTVGTRLKVRLDGKLVFLFHVQSHYTIGNGELTADHDFNRVDCK